MHSQEVLFEAFRTPIRNVFDRNTGSIGCNDAGFLADSINAFHQALFDLQILDDSFDHQVGFPDDVKIIFEIAEGD